MASQQMRRFDATVEVGRLHLERDDASAEQELGACGEICGCADGAFAPGLRCLHQRGVHAESGRKDEVPGSWRIVLSCAGDAAERDATRASVEDAVGGLKRVR